MKQYGAWIVGVVPHCTVMKHITQNCPKELLSADRVKIDIVRREAVPEYIYPGITPDDPLGGTIPAQRAFTAWKVSADV